MQRELRALVLAGVLLEWFSLCSAHGTSFYVATDGHPENDGALARPAWIL